MRKEATDLLEYIEASPSKYHAIARQREEFLQAGYIELQENEQWNIEYGKDYFVIRDGSTLAAFKMPTVSISGYMIMASHSDSPCFRIKDNPQMQEENCVKLNTEKYGGMLMATWFDRPLSIAGRVIYREKNKLVCRLINLDKDLCMLPSLAIHMNRNANDGYKYNAQKDMLPLISLDKDFNLSEYIAMYLGISADNILGNDLYLYNRNRGCIWGNQDEFLSSRCLDDLQCAHASMRGLLDAFNTQNTVQMHVVFDNEEVGSCTKQGADSTFLWDVMVRINEACNQNMSTLLVAISNSFMASCDNAHAMHPNYREYSDPTNKVLLNNGLVVKFNANQKYMTDGLSKAIFAEICAKGDVKYQEYFNKSDIPGGSTLGNISNSHVSIKGVDIGVAQLAMHSCYETCGVQDNEYLVKFAKKFYETSIESLNLTTYNFQ